MCYVSDAIRLVRGDEGTGSGSTGMKGSTLEISRASLAVHAVYTHALIVNCFLLIPAHEARRHHTVHT